MFTAAEPVAVAREPAIEPVGELAHERDVKHPGDEPPARENLEQLLDRRRALPGLTARSDELQRFGVGARRNPREARRHARCRGWDDLDLAAAIPPDQPMSEARADFAVAVVDAGVRPAETARRILSTDREANDRNGHRGTLILQ